MMLAAVVCLLLSSDVYSMNDYLPDLEYSIFNVAGNKHYWFKMYPGITIEEVKRQIAQNYNIPVEKQRFIITNSDGAHNPKEIRDIAPDALIASDIQLVAPEELKMIIEESNFQGKKNDIKLFILK